MSAETFVVILLSLAVIIISGSLWMLMQDFREVRRSVLRLEAKSEQTEPSDDPEEQFCREHKCTYYRPQEGGCTKNIGDCPFDTEPTTEDCSTVRCDRIHEDGVSCARYPACDDCSENPLNKVKGSERSVKGSDCPWK